MRNRYVLCFLLCCVILYFALPQLHPYADGLEGVFSISWLAFALLVLAGNLAAILFPNQIRRRVISKHSTVRKDRKRMRAN